MKKERERPEINRVCGCCEHSTPLCSSEHVLCDSRGVVLAVYSCPRFINDPLKRTPRRPKHIPPLQTDESADSPEL